jgi:type III secretory pathway component EscT
MFLCHFHHLGIVVKKSVPGFPVICVVETIAGKLFVSTVPFKVTDAIRFLLPGFQRKEEAVGMVLAHVLKTPFHGLESYGFFITPFALLFFSHDHLL